VTTTRKTTSKTITRAAAKSSAKATPKATAKTSAKALPKVARKAATPTSMRPAAKTPAAKKAATTARQAATRATAKPGATPATEVPTIALPDMASSAPRPARAPREHSAQARVIAMMSAPEGATLDAIMSATHWQAHTVRGFISGTARKKFALTIESTRIDGKRTYRVSSGVAA
jgi:hypothetical protein